MKLVCAYCGQPGATLQAVEPLSGDARWFCSPEHVPIGVELATGEMAKRKPGWLASLKNFRNSN